MLLFSQLQKQKLPCFLFFYLCLLLRVLGYMLLVRFFIATSEQFQATEVWERQLAPWTKARQDLHVKNGQESDTLIRVFGAKGSCVLHESLNDFDSVTGFPPDILHDLLEGIVPVELSLCIKEVIRLKYLM